MQAPTKGSYALSMKLVPTVPYLLRSFRAASG
jgi:hypothetical protein